MPLCPLGGIDSRGCLLLPSRALDSSRPLGALAVGGVGASTAGGGFCAPQGPSTVGGGLCAPWLVSTAGAPWWSLIAGGGFGRFPPQREVTSVSIREHPQWGVVSSFLCRGLIAGGSFRTPWAFLTAGGGTRNSRSLSIAEASRSLIYRVLAIRRAFLSLASFFSILVISLSTTLESLWSMMVRSGEARSFCFASGS